MCIVPPSSVKPPSGVRPSKRRANPEQTQSKPKANPKQHHSTSAESGNTVARPYELRCAPAEAPMHANPLSTRPAPHRKCRPTHAAPATTAPRERVASPRCPPPRPTPKRRRASRTRRRRNSASKTDSRARAYGPHARSRTTRATLERNAGGAHGSTHMARETQAASQHALCAHVAAGPDGGGYRAAPGPEVSVQKCKLGASEG